MPEQLAAIVRLAAPYPIIRLSLGMVHMGAANDTFFLAVPRV